MSLVLAQADLGGTKEFIKIKKGSTLNLMEDTKLCQKSEYRRPKLKKIKGQSQSKEH